MKNFKFLLLLALVAGMFLVSCSSSGEKATENILNVSVEESSVNLVKCKALSKSDGYDGYMDYKFEVYVTFVTEYGEIIIFYDSKYPSSWKKLGLHSLINVEKDDICYLQRTPKGYEFIKNETRAGAVQDFVLECAAKRENTK